MAGRVQDKVAIVTGAAGGIGSATARLLAEERFLSTHLSGYDAYRRRVAYRLLPMVW